MADNELDKSIEELEAEVLAELEEAAHDAPKKGALPPEKMDKAKGGVIDFFDLVRGFQSGNARRAYPYEIEFLMSVLTKDKIIDRFRKYFGGKKAMNNRTASKR